MTCILTIFIIIFRYDNETIFSYKVELTKSKYNGLDNQWHYFFDNQHFIQRYKNSTHYQ